MGIGELQTIATVSAFIAFVGVAWWAYSPKNKKRFEEDAQLALDDKDKEALAEEQRNKDKR
ncbi:MULTISPECIES: CcoQ/FixQ family Cbb3-type cytochrome c oxidase assembly chaperone [Psychrobacter]|jgi:cytochrome c oxidase cbb3-type subunit 4|uniref:CcoQ/FixQ family Cbb3-type cytochrome c oxidase assembly chaperone n=1 Tax=Psychrobacter faecalis TaxID=180588 RepID=A0ABT9HIS8_9GAMM|nr:MULTISPECIES: CcoQ/FixQ family Cbb3-type cytochrome c oxidase assembly chaperone [Psychrobacter]MBK3393670.1 CcoQ/FixQ family Cbb3-type cytochrome c oxidase assembly chaperone [Psychrobacter sp. M9-54-1]MCG3861691.1 CcoQ/FixQ family Cbb3-type cytochrome c oxidase assembly chaperone [Psychrobacter sp. Ps5]MDP4545552.1 CcoQ/FixQ family Cbb3-type cytochrome c oxidase assembly chaperone [Psychrobacter faecalis]OAP67632.1 cytochrome C [Psychrobacter sp. SHUES1]PKG86548.1 CcoQ/FixQ family Cbb3-ty